MQSTGTTAAGQRKDRKGRGDGATSNSVQVYQGTGVGTSTAVKDSTKPKTLGDPTSDSPDVIAMENEINRFVPRSPGSEPAKGLTRRPTAGSGRDRHQLPPGSSARGSNIPSKGRTPATTATQPTTAGSGKRRPS